MNQVFTFRLAGLRDDNVNLLADYSYKPMIKAAMGILDIFQKAPSVVTEPILEKKFTRAEVAQHCEVDSCWIIVKDQVYDITAFQKLHPGGREVLLECAGHDATSDFFSVGHSEDAIRWLEQYRIGSLVESTKSWSNSQ